MGENQPDPTRLRSLAVTAEDLIAALEANLTSDREAVLRVTPPFSGRMRARLHVRQDVDEAGLEIPPERFLRETAPSYPRPADTEDELRADPELEYTVERHREYHERALKAWRSEIRSSIRETVPVETPAGAREVAVSVLDPGPEPS